ncbi:MFS transporter [Falsibacillus pallidus]|uniref:Sugar phosphate permease n=1 Tax=Falsibacillus pallidus TaxID=493781 RepID=A0A370GEK9_9BACI|nr:MFS transporter [Falsibacillus pallidus]RDI42238.1 sugar phosphate permease [Falsibacillus pallidus]
MEPFTQAVKIQQNLFRNAKFLLIWITSIFSGLSISIYILCEQWYVVKSLNAPASLGYILTATTVPRVLFMALGGVLADYANRAKVVFVSLFVRALILILMAYLVWQHSLTFWALLACAFTFGSIDAFFWPSRDSILPSIVHQQHLTRANSIIQTTNQISTLLGPMAGALLLTAFSFKWVFLILAASLAVGSMIIRKLKDTRSHEVKSQNNVLRNLKEGLVYVKASPLLLTFMITFIIVNLFFIGPLMLSIPILVDERFGGKAVELSIIQSGFAAGMLAGALLMGLLNVRRARGKLVICLILLEGAGMLSVNVSSRLWVAAVVMFLIGICIAGINIMVASMIQEQTDPSKMGRVMSLTSTVSMGFIPLSYAGVSAFLSAGIQIEKLLVVGGFVLAAFSLLLIWKGRALREF